MSQNISSGAMDNQCNVMALPSENENLAFPANFAEDLIFFKLLIGKTLQDIITALVMPMTQFTLRMFVKAHNSIIPFAK